MLDWLYRKLPSHNQRKSLVVDTFNLNFPAGGLHMDPLKHLMWELSYVGGGGKILERKIHYLHIYLGFVKTPNSILFEPFKIQKRHQKLKEPVDYPFMVLLARHPFQIWVKITPQQRSALIDALLDKRKDKLFQPCSTWYSKALVSPFLLQVCVSLN